MARLNSNTIGQIIDAADGSLRFGCLWPDGKTIGNAASGGTARANADVKALFVILWNSFSNTELPVSGGRGASADADFAANKTITLPDLRGRVGVGKDNMGGTTASRITSAGSGIVGTTLGAAGGAQTHQLTTAQMPSHTHLQNDASGGSAGPLPAHAYVSLQGSNTVATSSAGSDQAHQNTQPSYIVNKMIVFR